MEQRESSHENAFVYRANCRQATFGPHNIGFLLARKTIANQILTHSWKNKTHKTFIYRSGRSLSFGEICRCQKITSRGSSKACPSVARSRLRRSGNRAREGGGGGFARVQAGKARAQQPQDSGAPLPSRGHGDFTKRASLGQALVSSRLSLRVSFAKLLGWHLPKERWICPP